MSSSFCLYRLKHNQNLKTEYGSIGMWSELNTSQNFSMLYINHMYFNSAHLKMNNAISKVTMKEIVNKKYHSKLTSYGI